MTTPLSVIILAAGKGTRMKSNTAKVLHKVFFAPMVHHVLNAIVPLQPLQIAVIVGHQQLSVEKALSTFEVNFVIQKEQLGTGHAVLVAEEAMAESCDTVLILCGDTPLIRTDTLQQMYEYHTRQQATLTLMTTLLENPTNYGRVVCDTDDKVLSIVEQKDANPEQLELTEINAGIYCVAKSFLFKALKKVGTDNEQGEVYLTDIVRLAVESNSVVEKYTVPEPLDVLGVNSRIELADAHKEMQMRRNRMLMLDGVSMSSPETTSVSPDSAVEHDTILDPGVNISDRCRIGQFCNIGQGSILKNCQIGDKVVIGPYSYLENHTIASNTILPPFSKS